MKDTSGQAPKLLERTRQQKLVAMLASMSQRFPRTRLRVTSDGFGVLLDDGRFLHITLDGDWSQEDTRVFLVLFAMWSDVDFDRLRNVRRGGAHGALLTAAAHRLSSNGRLD